MPEGRDGRKVRPGWQRARLDRRTEPVADLLPVQLAVIRRRAKVGDVVVLGERLAAYTQIRDVAHYQGLLVALTYYSLSYSDPAQVAGTQLLNSVIASVTEAFGGKVADGFAAFQGPSMAFGGSPCAAGLLIKLPDGTCNIHPSPAGHLLLAQAIEAVVGAVPPK